jgi:hypothetical protein
VRAHKLPTHLREALAGRVNPTRFSPCRGIPTALTLPLLLMLLTGCEGGNAAPTPLVVPMPIPAAGWAITQSSLIAYPGMVPLPSPSFAFPSCASTQQCWISYIEMAWKTPLTNSPSVTLNYTIAGSNPTFVNDSPHNSAARCRSPATLALLIHAAGDYGTLPAYQSYRWFSAQRIDMALGTIERTTPLTLASWINVNGQSTDSAGFAQALASPGSLGIGLGGGCFAAHGVAVSQGSATLTINSLGVDP